LPQHNRFPEEQLQWKEQGKGGRPRKRWRGEVEKELNIMGIKNGHVMTKHRREWRKIVLEANVYKGGRGRDGEWR